MYKNQKIYFSKPILTDEIKESIKKINKAKPKPKPKPKPQKQIIKKKTIISKNTKEQNSEKLLKQYGKDNNMAALLILLLKRKDDAKKPTKTKSTFRSGYRRSQTYQTRANVNKVRVTEDRKAEGKKTYSNVSALLNSAKLEGNLGNRAKEQDLLTKALKISENYLTNQDFDTYGKYLTSEERKNPQLIARMKKVAEESIIKAEEKRKDELQFKQNKGRLDKRLSKEKEMNDFIKGLIFTDKKPLNEQSDFFTDFKKTAIKELPDSYANSTFKKLLKTKYDQDMLQYETLGKRQLKKQITKLQTEKSYKEYFNDKEYKKKPNNETLEDIQKEIKDLFGKKITLDEVLDSIKIKPPKEPKTGPPLPKTFLNDYLAQDEQTNNINGIDKQIRQLKDAITSADKTKFTKLKKKTIKTEEEEQQVLDTSTQIQEVEDFKELLKQRKAILNEYIESGILPKDVKETLLPNVSNRNMTNDEYELELINLQIQLEEEPITDSSDEE